MTRTHLKKRLIPKLLIKHRRMGTTLRPVLVTTRHFTEAIDAGDPVSQAKIYEAQHADELVVLNIDRTPSGDDQILLGLIERLACETFMPLAVGGGVRSVEDFAKLLERGADKVTVNSEALARPDLIKEAAARFGAQCVVVSIDFRAASDGRAHVHLPASAQDAPMEVVDWAMAAAAAGAGEILLTDVDRDGTGAGLNVAVSKAVANAVDIPVILSGGCGRAEHFVEGLHEGCAEAVAAGTFFCFRDQNPMQTRAHIRNAGIAIRMET
jgi:cyclase